MKVQTDTRKVYIDFIKIIAILMVLFNHTGSSGFTLFLDKQESVLVFPYLFISVFIKIAVPLFFMASGALLLRKEEAVDMILKKRVFKYFVTLIVASFITYAYKMIIINQNEFNVLGFLTDFYSGNIAVAYWYLYAYLAFLCSLPFLRILAKNMNQQHYIWLLILYGLFQLMTILEWLVWKGLAVHDNSFNLFSVTQYFFYPLIGYYIDEKLPASQLSKKNVVILVLISVFSIIVTCIMSVQYCQYINEWSEDSCQYFFNKLIFLPAITVFFIVKYWFQNHILSERSTHVLAELGKMTFGIYLFEYIYRRLTKSVFFILSPFLPDMLACWCWVISAASLGLVVTFVLNKIPVVQKIF